MSLSKALAVNRSPKGLRYGNVARCALAVFVAHHTSAVLQGQAHVRDVLGAQPFRAAVRITAAAAAFAQTAPAPAIRVTFKEAIDRAIEKNPTVAAAASGILAAEGLIRQARAATLIRVAGDITWTNLNRGVEFEGATVTPQSQVTASVTAGQPILAGAAWARRAQAADTKNVHGSEVDDWLHAEQELKKRR